MRDITENKEVEIALQESEELYRKLITTIPDIIVRTTLKGDIIFVNEANFPFSNTVQPVNILGKNILSFVAPKDHDRAIQDLLMMFDKQMGPQEYRLILDEDNQIDSEIKGDILRDFNDNPYGLVLIIRDITQRKLAEEALRESEIKYKLLFNSSNDYILIHEIEKDGLPGKFTDVNDIACQRLGYSREELLQFSPFDIDDPQYVKIIPDMMKKLSEDKHAVWEGMHIAKDGSRIPVEISNRLFIMNGKSTILATIRDITDRKKNEIELQNYRQHLEELIKERTLELESVNRLLQEEVIKQKDSEKIVKLALEKEKEFSDLKSKFISIASHEFRTPLSIIYSSTELLERYGQNWDSLNYVKQIERIKLNIISLTEIMDDVLTLSRTEINKKQFSPKTKDLYKLCCNIKNDIKLLLSESQQFTFNYLPTERIFQFDEKLIRYILLNLLSNAVKYSGANGKILFNVMLEGGNLVFSIQDEGIGIPESDQEFLYEPFHRGSNVGEIKGTGLGMSIIRRFVDLHFGSIFFQSKENVGTKFTVHIPVKQNY
jgi:PAS domain S-box-containing protein